MINVNRREERVATATALVTVGFSLDDEREHGKPMRKGAAKQRRVIPVGAR